MMINVRYVTLDNSIVAWRTDAGAECSALMTASEVCEYLNNGGIIAPYSPPIVDPKIEAKASLSSTDPEIARVGEDLIKLLISKGIISESDLPSKAVERMKQRAEWRAALSK